jgi:hypothetical protein
MNGRVVVGALLSMLFSIATAEARGPYGSINVGNWKGGAYTNDQTGAFSHCVAGAGYDSGIYFMVLIDQSSTWSLGFQHPKWSFTNNQQFPIALTFDGQSPFYVQGVAISESLVRVPMPTDSALIGQFRKAKAMTAFTQGQLFQFKLDQTAQLLPTLTNCVAVVKQQASPTPETSPSNLPQRRPRPRRRREEVSNLPRLKTFHRKCRSKPSSWHRISFSRPRCITRGS